ncbi:hypothetical protein AKJ09_03953 [Labilithrix luteola]|uniref:Uncharacterized protein n=1 Tax=Labilithrix luteola TaxID=1391654 RepID=A0A0K1PVZ0_9BACT|nr:hypothetical protein AKJ09_03953 [Labilithrix luteola]
MAASLRTDVIVRSRQGARPTVPLVRGDVALGLPMRPGELPMRVESFRCVRESFRRGAEAIDARGRRSHAGWCVILRGNDATSTRRRAPPSAATRKRRNEGQFRDGDRLLGAAEASG